MPRFLPPQVRGRASQVTETSEDLQQDEQPRIVSQPRVIRGFTLDASVHEGALDTALPLPDATRGRVTVLSGTVSPGERKSLRAGASEITPLCGPL